MCQSCAGTGMQTKFGQRQPNRYSYHALSLCTPTIHLYHALHCVFLLSVGWHTTLQSTHPVQSFDEHKPCFHIQRTGCAAAYINLFIRAAGTALQCSVLCSSTASHSNIVAACPQHLESMLACCPACCSCCSCYASQHADQNH